MNKNVIVALLAGLLGGVATRYIAPPSAFAQDQTPVVKEIRAQSFTLVDSSNRTAGTFSVEPIPGTARRIIRNPGLPNQSTETFTPTRIVLRDSNDREVWSAGGPGIQPLSVQLK